MIASITFVAGPSLILVTIVLIGLAIYNASTKKRDAQKSLEAESAIRRCPQCGGLLGAEAVTCRHCGADTPVK